MEQDMTRGNPLSVIFMFTLPLAVGNIFQQLYNMADTIIVGRFVGADALAAVGSTGTIMFLLNGFAQGITAGFSVLTAQRFGAGKKEGVKESVTNGVLLSIIGAILFTVLSCGIMNPLLHLMNTPDDIFDKAYTYIILISLGMIANVFYNLLSSYLRAVGNSKAPLFFLVFSACLNVGLDLFFIVVLKTGVAGAAWATNLSQGVSAVLCAGYIFLKVPALVPEKKHWRLTRRDTRYQLQMGIPMALQFAITSSGTMIMQSAINLFGSEAVAAYTAACKVEQLVTQAFQAMGMTMATYSAQNWGIHSTDRIRKGQKTAMVLSCGYAVVIYFVVLAILPFMTSLFFDGDLTTVIGYVREYIQICGLCFIPLGMIFIYRNVLQGCGYALFPTLGGVVELISRSVFAFMAARAKSYTGICIANASAWVTAGIFLWIAYLFIMKDILKKDKEREWQKKADI